MSRAERAARWLFDHRADLLITVVYCCLAYLSFNALADYANSHHQFPTPWGGYAFAVAIDGSVLYAFISFRRAAWLAGLLLVSSAAATYTLQRWHAEQHPHPLIVSGVVPFFMILVTFAWHRIRQAEPPESAARVAWLDVEREVHIARADLGAATPAVHENALVQASRIPRPLRPAERRKVEPLLAEGLNANQIHQRTKIPYQPVRAHIAALEAAAPSNGGGS